MWYSTFVVVIRSKIKLCSGSCHLITEQQVPEHNLIFDLITTTVPNKVTSELVAEGRHKPSETNITRTTSVSITYILMSCTTYCSVYDVFILEGDEYTDDT